MSVCVCVCLCVCLCVCVCVLVCVCVCVGVCVCDQMSQTHTCDPHEGTMIKNSKLCLSESVRMQTGFL